MTSGAKWRYRGEVDYQLQDILCAMHQYTRVHRRNFLLPLPLLESDRGGGLSSLRLPEFGNASIIRKTRAFAPVSAE